MPVPECANDKCIKTHYTDAVHQMFYWDHKGYKRCLTCKIIISKEKYPERRCKCCNNKFRLRVRTQNQREYIEEKLRPRIDYSNLFCVICGLHVGGDIHKIYRFDKTNPELRDWYICQSCYMKRRHTQKKIDKIKLLLPNK